MKLAVTGGTGFVGSHLIDQAAAAGHAIRALTRRPMSKRPGVEWIAGALDSREALHELVEDADAIVHVAGVISSPDAQEFEAGNVTGTLALLAAATAAGVRRFVHVSSLAAREPRVSLYGASKARAEDLVARSGLDWVIVRPPAVYGPGDRETLELFRMAKLGLMIMPPKGRFSVLHVEDLVRLLLTLATDIVPSGLILEPDDGKPTGWSHEEFARALGTAVAKRPLVLSAPGTALKLAARVDGLLRGRKAKLTIDRVGYFLHRDWVVDPVHAVPEKLWRPSVETTAGLGQTAQWYRDQNWL